MRNILDSARPIARSRRALSSRDDLRPELWREDTFVDFEHSLNAAVKRLREILGDSTANWDSATPIAQNAESRRIAYDVPAASSLAPPL